jgi:hypothetical protein
VVLTVSGTTTDATRRKQLSCASGASFRDNASIQTTALRANASNGALLSGSAGYTYTMQVTEDFFRMTGVQVEATAASGASFNGTNQGIVLESCIFEHKATTDGVTFVSTNGLIADCLIVGRKASMSALIKVSSVTGVLVVNTTVAVPSDLTASAAALNGNYSSCLWKNCAFFGVTAVKSGTGTHTFTTCLTDAASPPSGCTTTTYSTAQFQNITDATRDYRIPSGSALIDVGTTDATNAPVDIAGTARPSGSAYDVGAWEFVAATLNLMPQICL